MQSFILFAAMVLTMGVGFLGNIITARSLGSARFGDLKFIETIWSLFSSILTFGFFYSGSRLLILENDYDALREIVAVILTIAFLIGCGMMLITIIIARPIDFIFRTDLYKTMIWLAPLAMVLPLQTALTWILQGLNKIYWLAVLNFFPSLLYLVSVYIVSELAHLNIMSAIFIQEFSILIFITIIVVILRPRYTSIKHWLRMIMKENRTYGGPVYLGSLANVATGQINQLALSYWVNNRALGFYSLAMQIVDPLRLIPSAVATSSFRDFVHQKRISRKVILATLASTVVSLIAILLFFGKPLTWIYTKDYAPVGLIGRIVAFGTIMLGFGELINRFLGAHGEGKALRNTAYIMGAVNVIGMIVFVPLWGIWGVVLTTVMGDASFLLFLLIYYRQFIHRQREETLRTAVEGASSLDEGAPG